MKRSQSFLVFSLLSLLSFSASASWYWPFGDLDPDSTNKPPRLHRLLEKANDYIELAEDDALAGKGDDAIENYRHALAELVRVEAEHPDRAATPEFAPLRNKKATCTAAIDAIRFAQIGENEHAVALTNTKDLEKKWRRKHNLLTPEDIAEDRREEEKRAAERKAKQEAEKKEGGAAKEKELSGGTFQDALAKIRAQDYAAAETILAGLEKERPDDLSVLQLLAAAQAGAGRPRAARRTLERAMRAHPKSYLPCYNLAALLLRLGEPAAARRHYEKGRDLGGPRNEVLERRLK